MAFADKFPQLWSVACEFSRLVAELDCAEKVRMAVERFAAERRVDGDKTEFLMPFRNIDREPTFEELCYGFAALNDGAGFPPIVPPEHELRDSLNVYWLTVGLLREACEPSREENVSDNWALAAQALLPRLLSELAPVSDSLHDLGYYPAAVLGPAFGLKPDTARKRLTKWQSENKGECGRGWIENNDRGSRDPAILYKLQAVRHLLADA